jgi:ribosomal-protein-alanine N-acetyltransferase
VAQPGSAPAWGAGGRGFKSRRSDHFIRFSDQRNEDAGTPAEVHVPNPQALAPDTIATERLILRRFRSDDAVAFHPILSDADAMRYWSTPPHRDLAETQNWIDHAIQAVAAGEADDFVALHEGKIIGKAGLWHGNELGMIFARSCWGRGFANEAVRAVVHRAFARGLASIMADVDPRNNKSLRLLRKLGFVETGSAARTLQIGDEWVDSVYFELRRA